MLNEQQINCHAIFFGIWYIWHTGKEAFVDIWQACNSAMVIRKVEFERRVTNDVVELLADVAWRGYSVALDDVVDGVAQTVEDKVETKQV